MKAKKKASKATKKTATSSKRPTPKNNAVSVKKLADTTVPMIASHVLARVHPSGEVAILSLENDRFFFSLNGLSAIVWKSINGKADVAKITARLIAEHDLPETRFKKDVQKLFSHLIKEKLVEFK